MNSEYSKGILTLNTRKYQNIVPEIEILFKILHNFLECKRNIGKKFRNKEVQRLSATILVAWSIRYLIKHSKHCRANI